jgi:hypothetical protein
VGVILLGSSSSASTEKNVFELHVSMGDALLMEIGQGLCNLLQEYEFGLVLEELSVLREISLVGVFENQVQVVTSLKVSIARENMSMGKSVANGSVWMKDRKE